jgi:hypothetical protein
MLQHILKMEAAASSEPSVPLYQAKGKGKGKGQSRTGHERPEGEQRYSSTLSLISALDGDGWSVPRPGRFTPGKDPVPGSQNSVVGTAIRYGLDGPGIESRWG